MILASGCVKHASAHVILASGCVKHASAHVLGKHKR